MFFPLALSPLVQRVHSLDVAAHKRSPANAGSQVLAGQPQRQQLGCAGAYSISDGKKSADFSFSPTS
jgi:hypothetical protein